jgi:hypothetical protein
MTITTASRPRCHFGRQHTWTYLIYDEDGNRLPENRYVKCFTCGQIEDDDPGRLFETRPVIVAHDGWLAPGHQPGHRFAVAHPLPVPDEDGSTFYWHYTGPAFVMGAAERIPA